MGTKEGTKWGEGVRIGANAGGSFPFARARGSSEGENELGRREIVRMQTGKLFAAKHYSFLPSYIFEYIWLTFHEVLTDWSKKEFH